MSERLRLRRNRSLWSRIHTRLQLGEADPDDTTEHRITQAGGKPSIVDADALAMLHEAAGGRLRDIDRIATNALKRAALRKLKKVDRHTVEDVAAAAD